MKPVPELYIERLERIKKAIALEKPGQTPFVPMADAFCAIHMGVKLSDFCMSAELSNKTMMKSMVELGADGSENLLAYAPASALGWFSKVRIPGKELAEDVQWQLDEAERVTVEDYDVIINKGFGVFFEDFTVNRLGISMAEMGKELEYVPQAVKNFKEAGVVPYCETMAPPIPTDPLSGGRSLTKYMQDLYRIPNKVRAVQDIMMEDYIKILKQVIREVKPLCVFVSAARGSTKLYSPKLWEKFIWQDLKKIIDTVIEEGAHAHLHLDGNWEQGLDYFMEFPKGKCVFGPDNSTNILKLKKKLGDRMCIKGDVPPILLTLGNPGEVYKYSMKLIREMGAGFILAPACTLPINAKFENVKAMIAAADGR